MADKNTYLSTFAGAKDALAEVSPDWVQALRTSAIEQFAEMGFPGTRDEDWRFTRIRPLLGHDFKLMASYQPNGLTPERVEELSFEDKTAHRLVFVNGHYARDLSATGTLPKGVVLTNLRDACERYADIVRAHLAQHADTAANPFVALNTAYMLDGGFLFVPEDTKIEGPIHLVFASTDGVMSAPRNLVVAERNATVTVVESYVGPNADDVYFTNGVTELVLADKADVDHYKLQRESEKAYHFGTVEATMGAGCRMNTDSLSLGGALVRNDINTTLGGERTVTTLDGLYMATRHQHIDHHTRIEHAMPNCNSYELYKGILDGRAKAVFNGRIHVHKDAQKTDAKQSNRCLLLSDDSQVNTNPQLEIYADDVKCTHGAAVGQINEDAVFYLRARGVAEADARQMLVYAFANEVIERVHVPALRDRLTRDLTQWLDSVDLTAGE